VRSKSDSYFSFPPQAGHNSWLDALRALAIILVLLRHGTKVEIDDFSFGHFADNLFKNGWIGVDLFFVLSGYLIAQSLLKQIARGRGAFSWRYFETRILRIVPAYYVVLTLCVIGFFPYFQVQTAELENRFLYHLLFLQDYLGANINVVFWSLGVEEKFYILVPLLILGLLKIKSHSGQLIVCLTLLFISPVARLFGFFASDFSMSFEQFFFELRTPFHMSLEGFLVGVVVALWQRRGWVLSPRLAKSILLLSTAGLLIWAGSHDFMGHITVFDATFQPILLALVFGLMLFCGVSLAELPMPAEAAARITARLSYALYLVHFPMLPLAFVLTHESGALTFWGAYLVLSVAWATTLHFLVEKPFLKLKESRAQAVNDVRLKPANFQ
jgi:peptidoglycan/LPS O-acetylase OafA/YrhL